MRLIISFSLCFFLLWQTAVAQPLAQSKNPQSRYNHSQYLRGQHTQVTLVSLEEFSQIKAQNPSAQEYRLNQRQADQLFAQLAKEPETTKESRSDRDDEDETSQEEFNYSGTEAGTKGGSSSSGGIHPTGAGVQLGVDAARIAVHVGPRPPKLHFPRLGGGGDDAVLFLLLIGAVIVVFMVVAYAFQFVSYKIRDMKHKNRTAKRSEQSLPRYTQRIFAGTDSFAFVSADSTVDKTKETGSLTQVSYRIEDSQSPYNLGLQMEAGQIDGTFILDDEESTHSIKGGYGLLGPTAFVNLNKNFGLDFSVLAGSTEHKTVGLVSLTRLALNAKGGSFFGQLSIGSLYVSLKASEGFSRYKSDFNALAGLKVGMSF